MFLRFRREDHGLNGYGLNGYGLNGYGLNGYVLVLDPELPGFTGGRFALGSRAKGQGGDGAPTAGARPGGR